MTSKLKQRKRHARAGATLLDVATGSMLLAVLLIPSVHLIGESRSSNRRLANQDILVYEAQQLLESSKVLFSESTAFSDAMTRGADVVSGRTINDGPDVITRVRANADATLPSAQLLTIQADVWIDTNRDGRMQSSEASHSLRTQWASP
jgi:hypothetical protein